MFIIVITFITVIFFLTLPQSIGLGDSGLLAAAASSLGIPHPPGFPSYVLLGHLFAKIPWGSVAWRLGFLSVLASVGTVWLVLRMAGPVAAIFLAFSYSFWSQAVNVETYALTNFVIMLVSFLVWQAKPKWWLIGVIGGIGVGLNPIVIAIVPSLLYLSHKRFNLSRLGVCACVAAVVAMATYSYLPIRAAAQPFLNWGDPSTVDRFLRHVMGGGLNIVSTTAVNGFTGSLTWYADAWVRFGYLLVVNTLGIGLILIAFGGYSLYKRDRTKLWYWTLLVFTNVSLAGLYTSGNRDSWFLMSFIALSVLAGEAIPVRPVFLLAALLPLIIWFPRMWARARSDFTTRYIHDLYRDLPPNAMLLGGGETFNALTVYAHEALGLRPDVTPVDFTIYYGQAWYRNNLKSQSANLKTEGIGIPDFSDELEFSRMLEQFVAANPDRPAFVTGYLLREPVYGGTLTPAYVPAHYQLEQHGIVYRVIARSEATRQSPPTQTEIASPRQLAGSRNDKGMYLESNYQKAMDLIRMEYALPLETEGVQLLKKGEQDQAFERFTRAAEVAPAYFDQNRLGAILRAAATATTSSDARDK